MSATDAPEMPERRKPEPQPAARPDYGLTRRRRLRSSGEFQEAFGNEPPWVGRHMVMWLRAGPGASARVGVVASKRTFRRAVERSRAKRLLREAFRLSRPSLRPDRDVVLVARRRILEAGCREVRRDLMFLAEKAGLVRKDGRGAAAAQPGTQGGKP